MPEFQRRTNLLPRWVIVVLAVYFRPVFRATPVRAAASATAAATVGTTRGSNMDGVMYSSLTSLSPTMPASACAAARFSWSLTLRARTSSIPRKKPGKQQELLIFGVKLPMCSHRARPYYASSSLTNSATSI